MNFLSLEAKNFVSFETLSLKFEKGLTLIDGWNYDLESANGAGKSSLVNCITYSVYGELPIGSTIGELVKDGHASMHTDVTLEIDGKKVRIYRQRGPVKIQLWVDGIEFTGTSKSVEERITQLVKLSFKQFTQISYIYQNAEDRFVSLNDSAKKEFLTSILGLEKYAEAYKIVHKRIVELEKELEGKKGSLFAYTSQLETQQTNLDDANVRLTLFAGTKAQTMAIINAGVVSTKHLITETEKLKNAAQASTRLDQLRAQRFQLSEQVALHVKVTNSIEQLKKTLENHRRDVVTFTNKLSNPPKECGECGQDLPQWDGKSHTDKWEGAIKASNAASDEVREWMAEAYATIKRTADADLKLAAINLEIEAEAAKNPDHYDVKITALLHTLKSYAQQINSLNAQEAMLQGFYDKLLKDVVLSNQRRTELSFSSTAIQTDLTYLEEVKKLFSPTGIRAYVFDSIVSDLNNRISTYTEPLFNSLLQFEYVSDEKNGKFTENLVYGGRKRSVGMLSGGEQCRLSLAIDLAISDVISTRMAVFPNLLILDEATNGMDQVAKECFMTLLQDLENRKDIIYVIDHSSEFKSSFPRTLRLEKRAETTRLS